ncbi:hypothetical protein Tco_0222823 [Tanacetum coccineum]
MTSANTDTMWGRWKVEEEGLEENDTSLKESKSGPLTTMQKERENVHAGYINSRVSFILVLRVYTRMPSKRMLPHLLELARELNLADEHSKLHKISLGEDNSEHVLLDSANAVTYIVLSQLGNLRKAERCSQGISLSKHKSEFDSSAQRLLLSSEPEQKASKAIVENGEIRMRKFRGYAFVLLCPILKHQQLIAHSTLALPAKPPQKKLLFNEVHRSITCILFCSLRHINIVMPHVSKSISQLTSLGEQWRKVMVPSPSSSDLETIVKACSNDDEVAEKVNKLAMAVMDSIDLMAEADPDFPNHGLFGVNAEPLASPNKRPFSPLALMQQSSPSES